MRLALFFVAVTTSVVGIGALDWWMDPFGDRYDPAPLRIALAHRPTACFVSHELVPEPVWPAFKLDLFRRRGATVIVVGTSRVAKLAAWPGERRFANLGVPGTGTETLAPLFRILHDGTRRRLTVYIGVDAFWFGERWHTRVAFTTSYVRKAKYLFAGETLRRSLDVLERAPGAILHPRALHPAEVEQTPIGCAVDTGRSVVAGAANAWGADGTLYWEYELTARAAPRRASLVHVYREFYSGRAMALRHLRALESALDLAQRYRWRVVGVALPIADAQVRELRRDRATAGLWADFRRRMPRIFTERGFRYLDLTRPAAAGCSQTSFSFHDGGHPDVPCSRRIRRLLDAAAGLSPS